MVLKSEKDSRLLNASKAFDKGLSTYNLSIWDDLLAQDVILHNDGLTLLHDLHGRNSVKAYYQAYIDRYNYEHYPIAGAVDDRDNVAFSFSLDKNVTPKGQAYQEQQSKGEAEPSQTAAIYHLRFDQNEKIKEIYFLRQLSKDEAHRKLKQVVDYSKLGFNAEQYRGTGDDIEPTEERAQKQERIAAMYNKIWETGDVKIADQIFVKDAKIYNLNFGNEKTGVDTYKDMVSGIFKEWEPKDNRTTIAVSAGNKAFIHWQVTGVYKEEFSRVYGLSLLVFDPEVKIKEVITMLQPFPNMKREMLKDDRQAEAGA